MYWWSRNINRNLSSRTPDYFPTRLGRAAARKKLKMGAHIDLGEIHHNTKIFLGSQWLGAHPKFIDRTSFSHQDLYMHPFSIFFLGQSPPPKPGWKMGSTQYGMSFSATRRSVVNPKQRRWITFHLQLRRGFICMLLSSYRGIEFCRSLSLPPTNVARAGAKRTHVLLNVRQIG
jgi:hypothetical protein